MPGLNGLDFLPLIVLVIVLCSTPDAIAEALLTAAAKGRGAARSVVQLAQRVVAERKRREVG